MNDDGDLTADTEYRSPRDGIELALASAAAAALGVERVGIDDDLFSLGLDSLSAVQLVARAKHSVGSGLAVVDVFEHPSIASLSEAVQKASTDHLTSDLDSLLTEVEAIGESGAWEILDSGTR